MDAKEYLKQQVDYEELSTFQKIRVDEIMEKYAETKVRESLPDIQNIILRGNISYLGGSTDQVEQTDKIAKEIVKFLTQTKSK